MNDFMTISILILCCVGACLPLYISYKIAERYGNKLNYSKDSINGIAFCYFILLLGIYLVIWVIIIGILKAIP